MSRSHQGDILEYLKKNLSKGYTLESLKIALIKQGYLGVLIDQSIIKLNQELAKKAPVFKEKPRIKYEILDEYNHPIKIKKPFFKRLLGL